MNKFHFLRRALWANAIFSGISGLLLLLGSGWLTPLLGLPGRIYAVVVGVGLLLFAGGLVQNALRDRVDLRQARLSVSMDLAWVVGTILVLAWPNAPFTPTGRIALLGVGVVVALMALLQALGLKRAEAPAEREPTFVVEKEIEAPPERVWQALADIGTIARWNPGVVESYTTTERAMGKGAERYCDLGGGDYLQERVVLWEPERRLTMRIVESNLPFDRADIAFRLQPAASGSRVSVAPAYRLRYGLLGEVLDRVYVRPNYRRGMEALLEGLRQEVEHEAVAEDESSLRTGESVGQTAG